MYPNHCSLSLVALGDDYEYQSKVRFWDNVSGDFISLKCYIDCVWVWVGFKMSCLKDEAIKEPYITVVDEYSLISSSDVVKVNTNIT